RATARFGDVSDLALRRYLTTMLLHESMLLCDLDRGDDAAALAATVAGLWGEPGPDSPVPEPPPETEAATLLAAALRDAPWDGFTDPPFERNRPGLAARALELYRATSGWIPLLGNDDAAGPLVAAVGFMRGIADGHALLSLPGDLSARQRGTLPSHARAA